MIKLWRKNSIGIGTWKIWAEGDTIFYSSAVVENGAETTHHKKISVNQSGRSLGEQIALEMDSRASRMCDKGYKFSREEALQGATNQLGLINPMLAKPLKDIKSFVWDKCFVQPKFDGHRCLITNQHGSVFAYSRKGKLIDNVDHLLLAVADWLPEGWTMDGELYIHGRPLQEIASIVKQAGHPQRGDLCFHWYDLHLREVFDVRWNVISKLYQQHVTDDRLQLTDTHPVTSLEELQQFFELYRMQGYEGAMLRRSIRGYEPNKRSDQLIKVKEREDCEVTVVGIHPSKDNWAICRVRLDNGKEFYISAPGSIPQKEEVLRNASSYIGRRLTVEYATLTNEGIPFHSVAMRWREDL